MSVKLGFAGVPVRRAAKFIAVAIVAMFWLAVPQHARAFTYVFSPDATVTLGCIVCNGGLSDPLLGTHTISGSFDSDGNTPPQVSVSGVAAFFFGNGGGTDTEREFLGFFNTPALDIRFANPLSLDDVDPLVAGGFIEFAHFVPDTAYSIIAVTGDVFPTPLPAALPLFATGIGSLGLLGWRSKRKARAVA